jgi:nitrogen fixation/metabolism regulation signal transduction histidine kinase
MSLESNQRRIIVVDPKLQFRFLILPLIVTITTAACLLALFVVQAQSLKGFASDDAGLVKEIGRVQIMAAVVVTAVLLFHVGMIVWLGLHASHKLAGPVYKLKKTMADVAAGNDSARIHLRDGDQLGELAEAFNEMMDALEDRKKNQADEGDSA